MDALWQDFRYALRSFGREPALTLIAILSLGLGIGASATVFTWLKGMVLDPVPAIPAWDQLVVAHTLGPDNGEWSVSWPDARDWRAAARTADLAAYEITQLGLRDGTGPTERAWGMLVSGNYFDALAVAPALGRLIRMDDERGRAPVAVLGHGYWQRRFAGDPGVVGRAITLNGSSYTVIGVAAPRFGGTYIGLNLHLYVPVTTMPLLWPHGASALDDRQHRAFSVVGRLVTGRTVRDAAAEVDPIARRAGRAGGLAEPLGALVRAHHDVDAPGAMRPVLTALLVLAGLVLLIACANVANLLLARAVARRREVAVRMAVGASRRRLVRQLLTESFVLASGAGALGVFLALWGRNLMLALLPAVPYPVGLNFTMDGRILAFAVGITAAAALVFGLTPALQASRPALVPTLKTQIGEAPGRGRLQSGLVVVQVALSLVTLVSAGLFVRTLDRFRSMDTGMRAIDRVLLVGTDASLSGVTDDAVLAGMVRDLLTRVRALPGVEAAAVARNVVLSPGPLPTLPMTIEGYAPAPEENLNVAQNMISDAYFQTTGIELIEGRDFRETDLAGDEPVAIVNEAFVRRFLADRVALGARIRAGAGDWHTIVGVVATSKVDSYTEPPTPLVFRALNVRATPAAFTLHVRATGDPVALVPPIRTAFAETSADFPFLDPRSMADFATIAYWPQKVGALMLAAVGLMALLLAAVGIYGVMSYTVNRRAREIGIRVALGALRRHVMRLVVWRAGRLVAIGLAVGGAAALGAAQLLESQLYGVSPRDPVTFVTIMALLGAVALLASWVPARRAARADPLVVLRAD